MVTQSPSSRTSNSLRKTNSIRRTRLRDKSFRFPPLRVSSFVPKIAVTSSPQRLGYAVHRTLCNAACSEQRCSARPQVDYPRPKAFHQNAAGKRQQRRHVTRILDSISLKSKGDFSNHRAPHIYISPSLNHLTPAKKSTPPTHRSNLYPESESGPGLLFKQKPFVFQGRRSRTVRVVVFQSCSAGCTGGIIG